MNNTKILNLINELNNRQSEWDTLDAKSTLPLEENGQKAELVKDIIALANSGNPAYLLIGVEDETFAPSSLTQHSHDTEKINQIIANKISPPINIIYQEEEINSNKYSLITINANDPPYFVAIDYACKQTDIKKTSLRRGMSFVRRANITDGLIRDDLDKILSNKKCNLQFTSEFEVSNGKNLWKPSISNDSNIIAELVCIHVSFEGCRILKCADNRVHSHTVKTTKTEPNTDFLIDLASIPARLAPRIGDWELKKDTEDGDVTVRIKVTGKNVVALEKNIRLSFN